MDGCIEGVCIGKSPTGEVMSFEVAPDPFDVSEFRRVFRQPLDGEPVSAGYKRRHPRLANVDRAVVEDYHNGLGSLVRPWATEPVKGFKKGDKIGAAGWN